MQMDAAQQYNTNGRGYVPLLEWAKQHTQKLHAPPAGQQVVITSGSNHAIDVSFSLIFLPCTPCGVPLKFKCLFAAGKFLEQTHIEGRMQNLVLTSLHVASIWHVWHVARRRKYDVHAD